MSWQSAMGDTGCAQLFSRTEQINDMVSVQGSEPHICNVISFSGPIQRSNMN